MEDLTRSEATRAIEGASSLNAEPEKAAESDELPMIVWLKGDEPYVADFSLDAEAAMAALSIKRSRLTQISGKELRVGRIRQDRYTRPVYRPADIQEYLKWTRSTATHQRAASAIDSAAAKLEERSEQLVASLHQRLAGETSRVISELHDLQGDLNTNMEKQTERSQELADGIRSFVSQGQESLLESWRHLADQVNRQADGQGEADRTLHEIKEIMAENSKNLAAVEQSLVQMREEQAGYYERLSEWQEGQQNFQEDIGKALALTLQFLRDISNKVDKQTAKPSRTEPAPRPMRRPQRRQRWQRR